MEIKPEVLNAALAGLLHDVGKMEQRSRDKPWEPAPGVEREGQPVHATWSTYFIQHNLPDEYRPAALAGAYHHTPEMSPAADKSLSELVALADKLSAGERADLQEGDQRPPRQMLTIFDRLSLPEGGKQPGDHYLPLQQLRLHEHSIFPTEALSKGKDLDAYEALCEVVRSAASQKIRNGPVFLENLLGAFQQAAWCVPSAYYHSLPDVSLYDHSRMTAALAACLAGLDPSEISALLGAVRRSFESKATRDDDLLLEKPLVLLIGGDISGIQDFLYTLSSKGAAQTLRGRSFYLQLLTEAVLRFVLAELGLPYTNVTYSGGGHFFLLAPYSALDKIIEIRHAVTKKLLRHHGPGLYLALSSTSIPANGFNIGRFHDHWDHMHRNVALAKQQRYVELHEELYEQVFKPPDLGGNPDAACSVCGEDTRNVTKWDEEHEEQAKICTLCRSFSEDLGKPLRTARFVALGFETAEERPIGGARAALREFGMSFEIVQSASDMINLPGADQVVIWALDDPPDDRWPESGSHTPARHLRYTVNRVPPFTLDELQKKVAGGFKRLGVLRMDMDNLGEMFKSGLGNADSLARLSTLSFQVSLFFEGWLKHICESQEYQDLIYAVYSGGDDVFLIGPWDIMPGLAARIHQDFTRYSANHPAVHLSAGLAFIGGKYPVYQAARDAADALEAAKALDGKNAISFLGETWKWPAFDEVTKKHLRLNRLVSGKQADAQGLEGPQAILQALRRLASSEAARARRNKSRPVWGPWIWLGAYQLTRMAERFKRGKPELAEEIIRMRDELGADDYRAINQWGAAARWSQLELRTRQGE